MFAQAPTQKAPNASPEKPADPDWAWTPYEPDDARPWNLARAGHLYRRAGFGADYGQLQRALADGPQHTVDRLLRPEDDSVFGDPAAFNRTYDEYEESSAGSVETLRAWWLRRMIDTPHPLLEKMTLFWHGHFATSNVKVNNAPLMHRHVQLLRTHALGRLQPLLETITRDPAVLLGLDCQANRKAQPNEGLARALLEVFCLGPGNYRQADVRETARALTGWFVLRGRLRYIAREHDDGPKTVLGQKGPWKADDVVRIVLEQPAASRLLVRKLYAWLICETDSPADALIAPLAESYAKRYDAIGLVETMLRSNLFFSSAAYRRRIKSPVEFALGIVKGLQGSVPTAQLGQDLAALGQNLYHPPTVQGWPGGRHWINGATLLGRSNLARDLLAGTKPYGEKLNPRAIANKHGHTTAESASRFLLDVFLQGDVQADVAETLLKTVPQAADDPVLWLRRFAHTVVTLPEFHLA